MSAQGWEQKLGVICYSKDQAGDTTGSLLPQQSAAFKDTFFKHFTTLSWNAENKAPTNAASPIGKGLFLFPPRA